MQVHNRTPFKVLALPGYDKDGYEVVTCIIKGTFHFQESQMPEPASEDECCPITMGDEYWGEPGESPMKYESDLAIFKPSTDVILLGHAYDYSGRKFHTKTVSLSVGRVSKRATVENDKPCEKIPLTTLEKPKPKPESNPKGAPSNLPPQGFGFFPKNVRPRVGYAGTYDQQWFENRSPFLPKDFDYRFFQSAYPELICSSYLSGGMKILAEHVSPKGPWAALIPKDVLSVNAYFDEKCLTQQANLDTVILEPDKKRLLLVWRSLLETRCPIQEVSGFEVRRDN